jgi:hypothetical protein
MKFNGQILVGKTDVQTVKFFRRTTMGVIEHGRKKNSLRNFLKNINPGHMGWDEPTGKLFYRNTDGVLHKVNFEQVTEYDYE